MAVFLPAGPPQGAALLRIYNMADAPRPLGWRTAVVPWRLTLSARRRCLAALAPDVVVMQGARHSLNRPGLYPAVPIVYDLDDADFHLTRLAGPVNEALGQVRAVMAGSRYIADHARAIGAPDVHVVWTGTPVSPGPRTPHAGRPPVVAWAQTRPERHTLEAAFVREVMTGVVRRHGAAWLRLYDRQGQGDRAFLASFEDTGIAVEWRAPTGYGDYLSSFDDVAVGLAPLSPDTPFSRGKSFGKVLAHLGRKVPVVASDAGEHNAFFTASTGVIANDPDAWVGAVSALLDAPSVRQNRADDAFEALQARLSIEAAAAKASAVLAMAAQVDAADLQPS